jgi:hypothetical protein
MIRVITSVRINGKIIYAYVTSVETPEGKRLL